MSATETLTPDQVIDGCKELLGRLDKDGWPGGRDVSQAIGELRWVVEIYKGIGAEAPGFHHAEEYPQVAGHPEAKWEALKLAAEDAGNLKAEVERLLAVALAAEEAEAA